MKKLLLAALIAATPMTVSADCLDNACNASGSNSAASAITNNDYSSNSAIAPTVAMNASTTTNNITGDSVSTFDGIQCANSTLAFTAGIGGNQSGEFNSQNASAGIIYSIPLGDANNNCLKRQKQQLRLIEIKTQAEIIKTCTGLLKAVQADLLSASFVYSQPQCKAMLVQQGNPINDLVKENKQLREKLNILVNSNK